MDILTPISNKDILNKLKGQTNIVFYEDLYKYTSLEQLLKNDSVVILYKSLPNFGHWTCIIRNKYGIEFFDSYGNFPDDLKKNINKEFLQLSNQWYNYLVDLLINDSNKYKIHYNNYKLQGKKNNAATCGKHVIMRILNKHLSTDEYNKWIRSFKGYNPDEVVSYFYNQL
jgi:hypothetical protein